MFGHLKQNNTSQKALTLPRVEELKCAVLSSSNLEALLGLVGGAIAIRLLPSCTVGSESWRSHSHTIDLLGSTYQASKHPAIFVENIEFLGSTPVLVGRALSAVGSFTVIMESVLMTAEARNAVSASASLRSSLLDSAKTAIKVDNLLCYDEGRVAVALSEIDGLVTLPGAYLTTERELRTLFSQLAEARRDLEKRESRVTAKRVPEADSRRPFVKAGTWAGVLVGGALGLECVNKAPWQDDSGAKPVTNALRDLFHLKIPAPTTVHEAPIAQEVQIDPEVPAESSPNQATVEPAAPEPEVPQRELLQAGLEKAAEIIFDKGGVRAPDIDLSSVEKTEQTLRAFASAVDNLPPQVRQKYALWGAIETLMKNFYEPEAVDKFKAAVDAISEGRPTRKPPEKPKVPPSHAVPPEFRNLPHFIYLDHKETVLPAIKESLRPYDAQLKSYGVPSPENRLSTIQDVTWTLREYSNAIWRVDPVHPAVESLNYECTQFAKAAEETILRYEKNFAGSKLGDEAYQKALPELEPLLNKMLDRLAGGLSEQQEREPSRDLSSLASATETLIEYQNAIGRATRGNPDINFLNEVIYGLKNDPKSQVDGLRAYLGVRKKPLK